MRGLPRCLFGLYLRPAREKKLPSISPRLPPTGAQPISIRHERSNTPHALKRNEQGSMFFNSRLLIRLLLSLLSSAVPPCVYMKKYGDGLISHPT